MSLDNPMVGEYTKGICKGADYFRNLQKRFDREKFDPKRAASDFKNPIFAQQDRDRARSIALSGLGRFDVKGASSDVRRTTKIAQNQRENVSSGKWKTVALAELKLALAKR